MLRKARFRFFLDYFLTHFPTPETELNYGSPFELLVAVVLSAQCTDKRVNLVMPGLLARFPTPAHLAAATGEEVFPFIRSVSYPNNKAKHLAGLGRMLTDEFGGEVPGTVEELQRLPGVGRKTANVVVSVIHNQPAMAVDTHVFRVARRLGLVPGTATTPLAVEKGLMRHIPLALVPRAHHWLILHGRYTCVARSPKCGVCPLQEACAFYAKNVDKGLLGIDEANGSATGSKKVGPKKIQTKKMAAKKIVAKKTVATKSAPVTTPEAP